MAKAIMIQGTMSNAGKSILCAALCRIFRQDGYKVAPFKSQNMALNSYITDDGLEMGRAQGYAEATVYSTRALTDAEKEEVSSAFGKLVGKSKLNITNVIDASLIGGVRVQIGNYTFDNTIAAKLEGLKKVLVG